ncbi:hypothetical protein OZL92_17085 [Bacillus sonorensis]|uniref:Uncharacterized protein n=1 Tax=Bacillus sonorensis L12 TaxID=1274524 RepID=M5PBS2_9BACI|nr:hypothetical protein [Bacillus sonorensis]EME72267.1 hypothetical protein BSONL12_23255 [Bacillus sonorensis L12]MCF7618601.1 hypothetical protein [Bacillus sonorensis]MCY7858825.1 hypothetical protein [Bacillus sonorensis]MCY8034103.1 hypothetical protein [Bacillus sonorensis]MCY8565653.1 hypothetical protein [Bacillus sonorensis]
MNKYKIANLGGLDWEEHYDGSLDFRELIEEGLIAVGDVVEVEDSSECPLPLSNNQFCVTFNKGDVLFLEEPFTLEECKLMFGSDFKQ